MKNTRRGFTLMELLLCIGIIGIVSAMGMTIAKRSADNAYNLYYYTGFKNLWDVCIDAHQTKADNGLRNDRTKTLLATHLNKYLGRVKKDGTYETRINAANLAFTTNNGIRYEVQDGFGSATRVPYIISMTIPYKKTSRGNSQTLRFYYYMNPGYTIPYLIQIQDPFVPNLMENTTLLPAYIDDGNVGRNNGGTYTPIVYGTYRSTLCQRTGTINIPPSRRILNCTGVTGSNSTMSSVKIADPRNVKFRRN